MSLTDDRFTVICPNCHARYSYSSANQIAEGQVVCQNCGRWIGIEGQVISVTSQETPEETYVPYEQRPDEIGTVVVKLWGHGFVFSIFSFFIAMVYIFMMVFLAIAGGIIGLILSIIVLAVMLGGVNIGLASVIWGLRLKTDAQSVLGQGGIIFVIVMVIGILLLPLSVFASPLLWILDLAVLPFLYGYVFRAIALNFQIVGDDSVERVSSDHRSAKCPNCGAVYAYSLGSRDDQGQVKCQNCSQEFVLDVGPDIM